MPPTARMLAAGLCMAAVLLAGCTAGSGSGGGGTNAATNPQPPVTEAPASAPAPAVAVVADGLNPPWDVARAPDGPLLFDERAGGLTAVLPDGAVRPLVAGFDDLFARGETGLMGLVLDPGFGTNRRFYTCQGRQGGERPDIAVIAWTVDADWRAATRVADPLLGGIPVNARIGRHGGCRLRFDPTGALLVGTGDNAVGSNAQDRDTLAGKVLRIDPATGQPAAGNPFSGGAAAYIWNYGHRNSPRALAFVWTYGHRNVQGLAVRPGTDQVYGVEQGTYRDDEVNLLQPGANY